MKKFISKVKKATKDFFTNKSAFSLVELIVVIAIMAVMAAVLAPSLLGYVEKSRMQKDDSAFDEVVNSIQLSLADQDVYDEMLVYAAEQYSCYVDSDSPDEANKVELKAGKYFMYNDNERQFDETVYKLDGVMRGVTITFAPDAAASNSATLDLIKGHINKYLPNGKTTYGGLSGDAAKPQLSAIADSEMYNSLRATIGDKINISSQTYRNSEYTIFISMGTTGGQEAAQQDAIKVWGQWSGTNLPEGASLATQQNTSANRPIINGSTVPDTTKTLNDYTWQEISEIAESGRAADYFNIGDEKTVDGIGTVFIIGFNHDDKSDGSGKSGITFMTKNLYGSSRMFTGYNNTGYLNSLIPAYLDNTVYSAMPNDLTSVIKTVNKVVDSGVDSSPAFELQNFTAKLWIPSAEELGFLYVDMEDYVRDDTLTDPHVSYFTPGQGSGYEYFTSNELRKSNDSYYTRSAYSRAALARENGKNYTQCWISLDLGWLGCASGEGAYGLRFGFCV